MPPGFRVKVLLLLIHSSQTSCIFANETTPLLHQLLPSLVSLDHSIVFEGKLSLLQESLDAFPVLSHMRKLTIRVCQPEAVFECRWSNPQIVYRSQITLGVDALTHLSRMSGLTRPSFILRATLPDADHSFRRTFSLFLKLHELKLFSESLVPISNLLARVQLPVFFCQN
ncbi:hypothetical protein J3R82DRAFT_10253 [Butyriboletus roseoflavus]|nr:hypothetical protein J3R82DRAFT_10253 [Butyriboletus roseoflavus]